MSWQVVVGGSADWRAGAWGALKLACALVICIAGCARHPLPELDFDDNGAVKHHDAGDDEGDDEPNDPKPGGRDAEADPMSQQPGDGDGDQITPPPTVHDASTPPPTPDASTEVPGDLTPHADNASSCPKQKPAVSSQCISFNGQCRYGTAPVVECQCIGIAWLCR